MSFRSAVPRLADDGQRPAADTGRSATASAMSASWTTPTLWVFVSATMPPSWPTSRIHSRPGELAVAVQPMTAGEDPLLPRIAAMRHDDRDTGPDRPPADDQRAVALDHRGVADPHAGDVGDGVERPGPAYPDSDAEIARSELATLVRRHHVM